MRTNRRSFPPAEIKPRSYLEPLDLVSLFGRDAPLEVDLGCGDGSFLVSRARENPEHNFIGVERLAGRIRSACRKIGALGLTNARVVQHDILHAVQQLFARESVDVFYLLFPDPWPKRRHSGRRIMRPDFLRAVARALAQNGELRIATDHRDYFAQMRSEADDCRLFSIVHAEGSEARPQTTFEERFRRNGLAIHRLVLRKISGLK